jgi:hypothetical protein
LKASPRTAFCCVGLNVGLARVAFTGLVGGLVVRSLVRSFREYNIESSGFYLRCSMWLLPLLWFIRSYCQIIKKCGI